MSRYLDVSVPLDANLPVWPGSPGFEISRLKRIEEGDTANVSFLSCELHTGTHIDAPLHFIKDGKSLEELPLELFVGPAWVGDFRGLNFIDEKALKERNIPDNSKRVLFQTDNSRLWEQGKNISKGFCGSDRESSNLISRNGN